MRYSNIICNYIRFLIFLFYKYKRIKYNLTQLKPQILGVDGNKSWKIGLFLRSKTEQNHPITAFRI